MPAYKKFKRPDNFFPGVLATLSIFLSIALIFLTPAREARIPDRSSPESRSVPATPGTATASSMVSRLTEDTAAAIGPGEQVNDSPLPPATPSANSSPTRAYQPHPEYSPEAPPSRETVRPENPGTGRGELIIVIDDAGYSLEQLGNFLRLPFPLTISVLPSLPHSAEAAALVRDSGKELLMHQPMQAKHGQDPGPGALHVGMGQDEILSTLERNLTTVPGPAGMNNHMGSAASEDPLIMSAIMELAKKKGIYYLDSLTTSGSLARDTARRIKLRHWERDVFLDNAPDRVSILRSLDEGKKIASSSGAAVMIGHVWSAELAQTLMEVYPSLVEQGYSLTTIARFMMRQIDSETDDDADFGD